MFFDRAASRLLLACALFLIGLSSGCSKRVTEAPPRYAVLRFENLSGDPSLEWAGRAASEFLSRSLAGAMSGPVLNFSALSRLSSALGARPGSAPGISAERAEALIAGATRLITGYVERSGSSIRVEADELDVRSGRSIRMLSASEPTVMAALTHLSHEFSPSAQPYLTSNPEALRLYVTGFESSGDQALANLERSVQVDPDFGPAWALLVEANLARGHRDAAKNLLEQAEHRPLDQFAQANLDLSSAVLRNDRADRLAAMRRISALSPGDTLLLRSTAEADTEAGEFEQAAQDWNKLAAVLPEDANAWNQLGYTRAWGGDYLGAVAAMKEYARLRPADPNTLDSLGDVNYLFRRYADAAADYLQAQTKNPDFQNGGDYYKAAWALYNGGDLKAADAAFARFKAIREKNKAPRLWLFEADWLYRTGRKQQAVSLLETLSDADAKSQLAIWDLLAGDRAAAAKAASEIPSSTGAAIFMARFVSLPSAGAEEWEKRAERLLPGPAATALRPVALGYALVLDGKIEDAQPVWANIVKGTAGIDFFARAMDSRLNEERERLAILPDPNSLNEFAAVLDAL